MKKLLTMLLVLVMVLSAAFATTAVAEAEKPLIILLMAKSTSPYSGTYMTYFVDNANNLYPDCEWTAFDAQSDATLQAQQAEEAIAMNPAVILMQPIDSNALVASAKKISEAGIPLINVNTALAPEAADYVTTFFGPDCYEEGQLAADLMHEAFPDGCTYVHLGQDVSNETGRLRLGGFQDRAEEMNYNFECLGVSPSCDWSAEKAKTYMSSFLSSLSGEIDAVWAIDDAVGYGALQAIDEDFSGQNDEILIVSVGGIESVLDAIREGENYLGTIYQCPAIECSGAMELAHDIAINGVYPEESFIGMDLPVITAENVDEFEPAY